MNDYAQRPPAGDGGRYTLALICPSGASIGNANYFLSAGRLTPSSKKLEHDFIKSNQADILFIRPS